MKGSRRCFWHNPATTRAAREARRLGGQHRMLAPRPSEVLGPAVDGPGQALAPAPASPPTWWGLAKRAEVLDALRDVGRAAIARRLDPRTANTAILVLQTLLGEERARRAERRADLRAAERERRADRRARREWARDQLRDRLEALKEEIQAARSTADLHRIENEVEYIESLVTRAHITPGRISLAVRTTP